MRLSGDLLIRKYVTPYQQRASHAEPRIYGSTQPRFAAIPYLRKPSGTENYAERWPSYLIMPGPAWCWVDGID